VFPWARERLVLKLSTIWSRALEHVPQNWSRRYYCNTVPSPLPLHNLSALVLTLYSEPGQGVEGGRATYCNSRVGKVTRTGAIGSGDALSLELILLLSFGTPNILLYSSLLISL
jgi:hypothetical protein